MQQTSLFEAQAQARPAIDVRATIQRKIKSLNLWLDQKSELYSRICEFTKKICAFSCKNRNLSVSLPCQNYSSGTDAAGSCRQFLYPHISENNTAAPRRVCGNAPGSFARIALTTRSAASLCQKILVMATAISATRAAQRAFSLKEWTDAKRKSLNLWLSTPSKFYTQICEFPVTRLLAIRVNLLSLCIIVGATAIEQQPVVSVVSALCAAWLVYRINQSDKKGGTL